MKNYSVIDLLKNHNKYKAKVNMLSAKNLPEEYRKELEELKKSLEYLDASMMGLLEEDRQMIEMMYIEGLSGRKTASEFCMCKTTIYKKRDEIIREIEENYAIFKKKDNDGQTEPTTDKKSPQ